MASALDKIKQGIVEENWKLVDDGYFDLTGNHVIVSEVPKKRIGEPPKMLEDVIVAKAPKKRGRPKKVVEVSTVVPVVKENKSKGRAPTKEEVDASIITENREKEEAKTQRVTVGRKPVFISE